MVCVSVRVEGKSPDGINASYTASCDLLKREDANNEEIVYAKYIEAWLKTIIVATANKVIKITDIKERRPAGQGGK